MQDKETQKWDTSSYGAGGSVGVTGGFNFNASTNTMDSDYKSVTEQAGIYAGNRGFDITVGGNTDLKGAVIDSTAGYENNTLNTGTLSFDDIQNKAEYSSKGGSIGVQQTIGGTEGMSKKDKAKEGVTAAPSIGSKDEDESTTKSAIAEARINIMKPEKQKQDITKLDRNTRNTLNKLGKIFDKDKIEEKQELAGLFQEMWHTTVGNLLEKNNISVGEQKALNILGGAIAAELGGADFKAGLTGGATTELLQSAFQNIKSQSLRRVAVALVAATVAKGTGQEAATAANVAVAIQKFNKDSHDVAEILNAHKNYASEEEREKDLEQTAKVIEKMRQDGWSSAGTEIVNAAIYAKNVVTDVATESIMQSVVEGIKNGIFTEPSNMDSEYEYRGGNFSVPTPLAGGIVSAGGGGAVLLDRGGNVYIRLTLSTGVGQGKIGLETGDGFVNKTKELSNAISGFSASLSGGVLISGTGSMSFNEERTKSFEAGASDVIGVQGSVSYVFKIGNIYKHRERNLN